MVLTREETIITHRGRPETEIKLALGMSRAGKLTAARCEVVQRGGAYAGYGIVTILYAGGLLHALYDLPAVRYDGFASPGVLINFFGDNAFLGIAAVGLTFVILSGGIDLSVGAVIGLVSVVLALAFEIIALMDGLQVQWVLAPREVDMAAVLRHRLEGALTVPLDD